VTRHWLPSNVRNRGSYNDRLSWAKHKISRRRRKVFIIFNERWRFGYAVVSSEMHELRAQKLMKEIGIQGMNTNQDWLQKFLKQNSKDCEQVLHKGFIMLMKKHC
jgi:hypothetical protein